MRRLTPLLLVAGLLSLAGCSTANYSERYERTPARTREKTPERHTFRVRLPDGRLYDVTPVKDAAAPAAQTKE